MRSEKLFWSLAVASIIIFWLGWYVIYLSFYNDLEYRWAISTVILFFGSLFYYLYLFICRKARESIIITGLMTMPSIILGGVYWYNMIVTWIIANALYFIAVKRIKIEQKNRIKINVFRTLRRGVPIIGTALSLLIAAGFYFSVVNKQKIGQLPKFQIQISQNMTNMGLKIINYTVPTEELKWILEGKTVDEYIKETMSSQIDTGNAKMMEMSQLQNDEIAKIFEETGISQINASAQEEIVTINRNALEKQLGIELTGQERIDVLINSMVNKRINEIFNGEMFSASVVPLGAAFGIFITVRSLIWVFNSILYWLATGLFRLFVWLKLILIRKEMREVDLIYGSKGKG